MTVECLFNTPGDPGKTQTMLLSDSEHDLVVATIQHCMTATSETSVEKALYQVLEWYAAEPRERFAVDDDGAALAAICGYYLSQVATVQ